jgi:2-oxoglutarate ferredoxin oxidoreductase subunit beta
MTDAKTLTKNDLKSDQEVRWCPGCGDYAILSCVQGVLAELGIPKERFCVVSGIGCSSRFPYYMDTYGFHSIHGRAPAVATGIKVSNPDLSVWLVTGDGDGLSIGGNHTIHLLRRNVDVKVLLFNNEIYGLTKGQYSPTSPVGQKSKSTPFGSVDRPFNPISLALGAGATFAASTIDTHMKHMAGVLRAAAAHKGAAFVEIYQNCVIFNDGAFNAFADKNIRDDKTIDLIPGQPLVYGKEHDKGIRMDGFELMRVPAADATVWDPSTRSPGPGFLLSQLHDDPEMPNPIGIFRDVQAPVFDDAMNRQISTAVEKKGKGSFRDLVYAGDTWKV